MKHEKSDLGLRAEECISCLVNKEIILLAWVGVRLWLPLGQSGLGFIDGEGNGV